MVATITRTTSLNSFWSIVFCLLVLCLHGYASYVAAKRYEGAATRAWPRSATNKGGRPFEVTALLTFIILSTLFLPLFVLASFLRIGNYANDGVKLGRDHALNPNLDVCCSRVKNESLRRFWRNCLPLAQTSHLLAAFLLLLPDCLLTAVEVQYGYKATDSVWSSDIDFFYPEQRAHVSDVMAKYNLTNKVAMNRSHVMPASPSLSGGWSGDHSLSLAFVNFVLALLSFSVRYAAVFWYTNKVLTLVFALQLMTLTLTSALGYSAFSSLYKVCYNQHLYINVHLIMGCPTSLALYLLGCTVMFLSTITVFEYISHYFDEKLHIIEQKHQNPESAVPRMNVTNGGCQGYVTHTCAMLALVVLAACKGPVMYDLVNLYRPTHDSFLLTGLVCEVAYMVLWIVLWFGLTVKQRWQFRILDYVPLGRPMALPKNEQVIPNPTFKRFSASDYGGSNFEMQALLRPSRPRSHKRNSSASSCMEFMPKASRDTSPEPVHLESQRENGDPGNFLAKPKGAHVMHKVQLGRRQGSRQTLLDEGVHGHSRQASDCSERAMKSAVGTGVPSKPSGSLQHINIRADVHDSSKAARGCGDICEVSHSRKDSGEIKLRRPNTLGEDVLAKDYRNSIRSKCDDIYVTLDPVKTSNNLNSLPLHEDGLSPSGSSAIALEPLPTLMSSFRDKVKESSRAANNYREQNRNLQLGANDRQSRELSTQGNRLRNSRAFQPIQEGYENPRVQFEDGFMCVGGSQSSDGRSSRCGSIISSYGDEHSSAFKRINKSNSLPHSKQRHSQLRSIISAEYQHNSLPPDIKKNGQLIFDNSVSERLPIQQSGVEEQSTTNVSPTWAQRVHSMPGRDTAMDGRLECSDPVQNGKPTKPK